MHLCAQCQNFTISTDPKGYFIFSVPSEDGRLWPQWPDPRLPNPPLWRTTRRAKLAAHSNIPLQRTSLLTPGSHSGYFQLTLKSIHLKKFSKRFSSILSRHSACLAEVVIVIGAGTPHRRSAAPTSSAAAVFFFFFLYVKHLPSRASDSRRES